MILFSDFDKTLHPDGDKVGFQRNLESVREFRQKGNLFCIATGRSQASLGRAWLDYEDYLDYGIFDNGAVCLDQRGGMVFQEAISVVIAGEIVRKITDEFGDEVQLVFYHDAKEWRELDQDVTKVRCWTKDVAVSQAICNTVKSEHGGEVQSFVARTAVMSSLGWIENPEEYVSFVDVMSVRAGKYNAVKRLCEKLPNERVVTVGDDTNDLRMIQEFDGYAMRDSAPEVLEIVEPGHVVGSVEELLKKLQSDLV